MTAEREMTLREFINTLPKCHRAVKELESLEARAEDIANARLIAAAPDLFYACQCILVGEPHARKAAQDAILKATGGVATMTMTKSEMIREVADRR